MEKQTALDILEDIQQELDRNGKDKALKTVRVYRKGLEMATNEKIKNLIEKHCEYIEKYGENDRRTLKISKKIDDELQKIYNK